MVVFDDSECLIMIWLLSTVTYGHKSANVEWPNEAIDLLIAVLCASNELER